jgi:hypothetical protein
VTFAPTEAIWVHGPEEADARLILKPLSLKELSVQDRSIRLEEAATAERSEGADGIAGVAVGVEVGPDAVIVRVGVTVGVAVLVGVRVAVLVGVEEGV